MEIKESLNEGIYYVSHGSAARQMVGIHGWSGDHTTFDPLMSYLPAAVSFHSLDLPGIGRSEQPRFWELRQIVDQIARMIVGLGRGPVTLIGSCSGGLMCLFVARHLQRQGHAAIIERVVMIDAFAYLPWYFQVFVSRRAGRFGWYAYRTTFANAVGRWLTNLSLRGHRKSDTDLTRSFREVNHAVTYKYLMLLGQAGDVAQFQGLDVPVDLVFGESTFGAVRNSVEIWKKNLPDCRYFELKGAGHLPIDEATSSLAAIIFGS